MKAEATSWKIEPVVNGVMIPFDLEIDQGQFERICNGLIPEEMEDKWFIYYDEPYLYLHRGWTGQPVYRIKFEKCETMYRANEAQLASDLTKGESDDLEYEGKFAHFLICNLLLRKNLPFPKTAGMTEPLPGIYQHHLSGTGYQEETIKHKKNGFDKIQGPVSFQHMRMDLTRKGRGNAVPTIKVIIFY